MFLLCALLCSSTGASSEIYGPYVADYLRTIDGDTVEVVIHIYPGISIHTRVRERTIDTPDLRSRIPCEREIAEQAATFTRNMLESSAGVMVTDVGMGTFAGRIIGTLYIDGVKLGDALVSKGLAVKYSKRNAQVWCRDI